MRCFNTIAINRGLLLYFNIILIEIVGRETFRIENFRLAFVIDKGRTGESPTGRPREARGCSGWLNTGKCVQEIKSLLMACPQCIGPHSVLFGLNW